MDEIIRIVVVFNKAYDGFSRRQSILMEEPKDNEKQNNEMCVCVYIFIHMHIQVYILYIYIFFYEIYIRNINT